MFFKKKTPRFWGRGRKNEPPRKPETRHDTIEFAVCNYQRCAIMRLAVRYRFTPGAVNRRGQEFLAGEEKARREATKLAARQYLEALHLMELVPGGTAEVMQYGYRIGDDEVSFGVREGRKEMVLDLRKFSLVDFFVEAAGSSRKYQSISPTGMVTISVLKLPNDHFLEGAEPRP